jgi:sodium/hydrogen antiporter
MLPVALALQGTKARAPTVALMGWLGPRGAGLDRVRGHRPGLPAREASTIIAATYLTIGGSVLLHGLSAAPLVERYVRWYERHPADTPPAMESGATPAFRARGPVPHAAIRAPLSDE